MLDAPREAIHNETFNVGRTEENYRISELADIVAETVPGCRVEYAPAADPTNAATASIATRSTACCLTFARSGPRVKARRNSMKPIAPLGLRC